MDVSSQLTLTRTKVGGNENGKKTQKEQQEQRKAKARKLTFNNLHKGFRPSSG